MARIRVKSSRMSEFNTNLSVKGTEYHIQTEKGSEKHPVITTTAYLKGTIVDVIRTPYPDWDHATADVIKEMMGRQHFEMSERLQAKYGGSKPEPTEPVSRSSLEEAPAQKPIMSKGEYSASIKQLIAQKKWRPAFDALDEALGYYPDDPFMLSYYGYLKALVQKHYKEGISICIEALKMIKSQMPVGGEFYYPIFYLNLGKTYNLYGRRNKAIESFRKGLEYDVENKELFNELKKLGFRKTPPIPFLPRENTINKYIGMALSKLRLR